MIRLSQRLQTIADMIPAGATVADIGTDHAFLPCYLIQTQRSPQVIGVEVRPGPYQAAYHTVQSNGFTEQIELRLSAVVVAIVFS